ncbi:MAG TPA: hypothetical protein VK306_02470 [Acidimicrobiales bacterium]|nr:hypothetical protein [Acidimicrobiales bacterium]
MSSYDGVTPDPDHDFGAGWPEDLYADTAGDDDHGSGAGGPAVGGLDEGGGEVIGAFDVDPADVTPDDDLDFTGEGHVDRADLHEAPNGLSDFHVEDHAAAHDGGHDHGPDPVHLHHRDGGFFGA